MDRVRGKVPPLDEGGQGSAGGVYLPMIKSTGKLAFFVRVSESGKPGPLDVRKQERTIAKWDDGFSADNVRG